MSGLGKAVHINLQKYIDGLIPTVERGASLAVDHVEVNERYQRRTVILRNGSSYLCVMTDLDYTEYVHGRGGNESEPILFRLPSEAIIPLMLHYVSSLEHDRDQLQLNQQNFALI
ncbi:MAG: hypothetical protein JWM44_2883 [Bacilli bacterium]|nr:hypothetical protein [Bacilli bacterium]